MELLIRRYLSPPLVLLGLFAALLTAGPAARNSIAALSATADAIVVGTANSLTAAGTTTATISVEQVLKGVLLPGTSISVTWTSTNPSMGMPSPCSKPRPSVGHGIFFLRENPSGSWSLLPATLGDASWGDLYVHTPTELPAAIRAVVAASLPSDASPFDRVLAEMVTALEAGAPVPDDLVETARYKPSAVLTAAFSRFLSKQDRLLMVGLRGSLLSGDPSPIRSAQRQYAGLSSAPFWTSFLQDVRSYYLNPDPAAVQILGEVAADNSTGADLRSAVAAALARMHTKESLPYLAALLTEKNITLEAMAVGGLSSFANNVPIGSHEPAAGAWPYRTDETIAHSAFDERIVSAREDYYVGFWLAWWQQNRSKLQQ